MNPDEEVAAAIRAEIEKVRLQYLSGVPSELSGLAALAANLAGDVSACGVLEELRLRLHRLAGSGGTFGLPVFGAQARRLENDIDAWLKSGTPPGIAECDDLRKGIAALQAMLAGQT